MGCSSSQYMLLAAVQDTSRMNSPIMPWQLHLFFFLFGSLLCLVGSSLYKSGVQHNVPMSSFAAAGCVPCHESPYGSTLNSEDIKSCGGPYLFVGVQKEDRSALEFGALVSVEVLRMDASKSAPYLSNGVYWHFTKGCSFGFEAVEHNLNVKDEESSRSLVSTNRGVSWRIDQSIDCTSLDDFTIQTLIDTSKWRKQIFNCPEYPASVLLSEKEQERGKEHREISAIHILSPPTPCAGSGSQATLYTSQEFAVSVSPVPSMEPLLVAVTSSIKTISNVSDIVVSLKNSWKKSNNVTYLEYIVVLKESKSRSALVRLNASISSNTFSSTLSKALGAAITVKGSYSRYSSNPTTDIKDPSTLNANMLWFAIVPLLIASVVGYQCYKHVLHMALEQEQARARARASQYEGGSGSGSAVHVSASGTTFMPYNSNQLPSAEATVVSQGSPATYEMATAVVTTSKIV